MNFTLLIVNKSIKISLTSHRAAAVAHSCVSRQQRATVTREAMFFFYVAAFVSLLCLSATQHKLKKGRRENLQQHKCCCCGLFELTRRPSRALNSPRALLLELQRYKDTVRCAARGAEVPGHRQQLLTQTLIVRFLKTHFFTSIFDFEKSTE